MKLRHTTPTSLIADGYTTDLVPWWRHYLTMLNPFKHRPKKVLMVEVLPVLEDLAQALGETLIPLGHKPSATEALQAYEDFKAKHDIP